MINPPQSDVPLFLPANALTGYGIPYDNSDQSLFKSTSRYFFKRITGIRVLLGLVAVCCLLGLTVGCDRSNNPSAPQTGSQGVTGNEILLGSSLALKGHASFLGTQTLRGAMCYLNHVNA
ncbi:MAG: hypothetical protein AB7S77_23990, partial [Desulfatirhabdiaceae bacterium]